MKKILITLVLLISMVEIVRADGRPDVDTVLPLGNNRYMSAKDSTTIRDVPVLKLDSSNNLVLNTDTSKTIKFNVGETNKMSMSSSGGFIFPSANFEAIAGAGTTVADAAALSASKHVHQLTGANGTVGWKFATSVAGQFEFLLNTTAGIPKIYAASGGTCNGGAANAACTLVTGIVAHLCYSTAADTWICS